MPLWKRTTTYHTLQAHLPQLSHLILLRRPQKHAKRRLQQDPAIHRGANNVMRIVPPLSLVDCKESRDEPYREEYCGYSVEDKVQLDCFSRVLVFLEARGEDGRRDEEEEGQRHEDGMRDD